MIGKFRYPDAIFDLLPQLVYLDETDREGNPMNEDEDEDDGDERELGSDEDLDEYVPPINVSKR